VTRLRKMILEELQRRNYSDSTVRIYLATIRDFSQHFGQPPDQLGAQHIRAVSGLFAQREKACGRFG
jgi:integrase/recombinase XerD